MAAGSTHCLALTEDSEVHSWGNNDQCQHFDTLHQTKPEPAPLPGMDTKHIVGIACGPAQVRDTELRLEFCCALTLRRPWLVLGSTVDCVTLTSSRSFLADSLGWRQVCFFFSVCVPLFPSLLYCTGQDLQPGVEQAWGEEAISLSSRTSMLAGGFSVDAS